MPAPDLDLLTDAAKTAGKIAMRYFRNDPKVTQKADKSPVSEADLAVNTWLESHLQAARPEYGWLSEETPDTPQRLSARRVFVVDPIDGTRAFVDGQSAWGVALAVVEAGLAVAGVMHMPAQGKTYTAARGVGSRLNGAPLAAGRRATLAGASVLANKAVLGAANWARPLPEVGRHYRPSLIYRMCLVAEGRFDATITLRDSADWDIAPGAVICDEAGATVSTRAGSPPRFNQEVARQPGLIVANPVLHAAVLDHLNPH